MDRNDVLRVVVVTHNSARYLPELAAGIAEGTDGARAEVVVVDSGSSDDTVARARELFAGGRVIDLGWNAGYAAAINVGIAATTASGPVVILNPDTRPRPGSLVRLVAPLGTDGIGITAARLVEPDGSTARSLRRAPTIGRALGEAVLGGRRAGRISALGEVVVSDAAYAAPVTADWATGAAIAVAPACLDAVGPWNESFFLYSEETDFALRAAAAGYTTRFVPDAVVEHKGGDAMTSPALFALLTVNRVRCYALRHGRVATAAFWLAIVAGVAVRAATGRATHRAALRALFQRPTAAIERARGRSARATRGLTTASDPGGL